MYNDLGHNATVWYRDVPYFANDGETFYCEEVSISDKMNCTTLIPREALNLLAWLEREKPKLERLAQQEQTA